jgi:PAS domain S-box-containing protein
MQKKRSSRGGVWFSAMALIVVFPIVMAVAYWLLEIGGQTGLNNEWVGVLGGVYGLNILLAFLTIKSLRRMSKSEKELGERAAKDEALLSSIGEGIVVTDKSGLVEKINPPAEKMVGWKNEEVVGKKWFEIALLVDDKGNPIPAEKRATQRVLATGQAVSNSTYNYIRRDGTIFPVGTTAAPVIIDGKTVGVIAVFRDITKEKEIDRAKSEFVSLASHQLRTPLSAIRWYAEMLMNGDVGTVTEEQKEYVKAMYQSNERMIELVNSLLNISRIESGRIKIDPEPTDLGELVKQVLSDLTPKIKAKNQNLAVSVHPGLPKINIDPKMIRQVYMNLLTNALKYTPEGGEINVMISRKGEDIISQVADSGCGIPQSEQDQVFEKFFRADNAQKMEADGTGLGLYLAKSIVGSSQGKLWFESREGKGSTFWFSLPVAGIAAKKGEVTIDA